MKRDRWLLCLTGGVLAFLLSLSTVYCLATAFGLMVEDGLLLVLACLLFSLGSALSFQLKFGSATALCLAAMGLLLVPDWEALLEQCASLVYRISGAYDRAYGWGVLLLGDGPWNLPADRPLQIVGYFATVAVSFVVCRRQAVWAALLPTVVPLLLCMVVTDTVPAPIWLFLFLLGLLVLVMTSSLRRKSVGQSNTLTLMAAAAGALALGLLFLTNPQEDYVNRTEELQKAVLAWVESLPNTAGALREQLELEFGQEEDRTESEDLRNVGVQYRQTYPVMDVTPAVTGYFYLRGQDFDVYSGTSWSSTRNRSEELPDSSLLEAAGQVAIHTRRIREVLYLPYYPSQRPILVEGSIHNIESLQDYSYTQKILPGNWQQLVTAEGKSLGGRGSGYLQLPQSTRQWAESLAEALTLGAETATGKADAIGNFVRAAAEYDLETQAMPAGTADFAKWFLTESDTGYCVHFASAATVLLRAAGVEARYVTGYLASGEAGHSVTVTAAQAHAWAEYYEPSLGVWIPLEATPGRGDPEEVPPETTEPETTEAASTETSEATTEAATEATTEATVTTEAAVPVTEEAPTEEETPPKEAPGWLKTLLWSLLGMGLLLTAVQGQLMVRLELRRRWYAGRGINGRALEKWNELLRLSRLGREKPPRELEALAQKAKFSQHTLTAEELALFDRQIAACRRGLRTAPWYLQLLWRYVFAVEL